jgi:hypothetical protein
MSKLAESDDLAPGVGLGEAAAHPCRAYTFNKPTPPGGLGRPTHPLH